MKQYLATPPTKARAYLKTAGHKSKVVHWVGRGSFADVYALGNDVVVKIIDPAAAGPEQIEERTRMAQAEVAAYQALADCPHVMSLLDVCILPEPGRDVYLLFLPRMTDLSHYLLHHELDCFQLLEEMGLALRACHSAFGTGIMHTDLCLSNIYISKTGAFVLGDFGAAAYPNALNEYGHDGFIAPDQLVTPASDIYALGRVVCAAASAGGSIEELPLPLRPIVEKCVQIRATDRFQSAEELLSALRAVSERGGTIRVNVPLLRAKELYAAGDTAEALRCLQKAPYDAHNRPMLMLLTYLNGVHDEGEQAGFRAWSELDTAAHDTDDAKLLFVRAWILCAHAAHTGQQFDAGLALMLHTAELGFVPAQHYAGHMFYFGQSGRADADTGLAMLHAAAAHGYFDSLRVLNRIGELTHAEKETYLGLIALDSVVCKRKCFVDFL